MSITAYYFYNQWHQTKAGRKRQKFDICTIKMAADQRIIVMYFGRTRFLYKNISQK